MGPQVTACRHLDFHPEVQQPSPVIFSIYVMLQPAGMYMDSVEAECFKHLSVQCNLNKFDFIRGRGQLV